MNIFFQSVTDVITDFGAVAETMYLNTEAIKQAVQACSKAGGGRVVILPVSG